MEDNWVYDTQCDKCGKDFKITEEERLLRDIFEETSLCPECDKEHDMAKT